jgi:hypothetical protein
MSFLSRLFKKKKEDAPEPHRPAPPIRREAPRPQTAPISTPETFGTTRTTAPQLQRETSPAPATAPLGSASEPTAPFTGSGIPETPLVPKLADDHEEPVMTLPEVEAARTNPFDFSEPAAPAPEGRGGTVPFDSPKPSGPTGAMAATAPLGGSDLAEGFFDELLDDFDANFDAAIGGLGEPAAASAGPADEQGALVVDQTPVRELFADIAANYVRAVRNFMIEVHRGDTAKEWIDICQPAVHSIKRAAEKMELADVHSAIEDFDAVLELASGADGRFISGEVRDELVATYESLVELMPQAFTLDAERDQRESIIIHSLLLQVPDVRKVTIDKLYAAGLTTLEVFFLAKPEDLAATAGIPDWLAGKIVEKFQGYRNEMHAVSPDASRSAERAKLATLVGDLKSQQEAYERASSGWTEDAAEEKKRLRQARQETLLQIQVVLAQLGEVDFIHEIEKLPFERRIDRLTAYLDEGPAGEIPL